MTSLFDLHVERTCDRVFREAIAPGGWLREQIRLHVGWQLQGYEPGYGPKDRKAFTASVADRIHEKARERLRLFGIRLWRVRYDHDWCAKMAEEVVTNWLADDRIKFGDPRYDWTDGQDIADSEMSYWEAA